MRSIALWMLSAAAALSGCATPGAGAPTAGVARVNGVELPYVAQGQGTPVVFVHGSMSDQRIWEAQRPAIAAAGYRYIAYTQRYFGSGAWPDDGRGFSQPTHAADLVAFIQQLGAGPVHVVAWSYGGSVATLAASEHPTWFRSLSLHEPTIGSLIAGTPEGKVAVADFGGAVGQIRAVANAGDTVGATARFWEFVAQLPAGGLAQESTAVRAIVKDNERSVSLTLNAPPQPIGCEKVGAIRAPMLVTVGSATRPLWAQAAIAVQRCAERAELARIPGGHDAIVQQAPAFNAALLGFLARH